MQPAITNFKSSKIIGEASTNSLVTTMIVVKLPPSHRTCHRRRAHQASCLAENGMGFIIDSPKMAFLTRFQPLDCASSITGTALPESRLLPTG